MANRSSPLPEEAIPAGMESVTGGTSSLRFPHDHAHYFTILQFVEFKRSNPKQKAIRVDQASIVLPLPLNLHESYGIQYAEEEFGLVGGLANVTEPMVNKYIEGGTLEDLLQEGGQVLPDFAKSLARRTMSALIPGGIFDRFTGTAINPHITAVFEGVHLRTHQLHWRVAPETKEDSQALRDILKYIRSRMHPTKKNEFLLNFPNEVYVKFLAGDKEILYPIFKSVVTELHVDNSADGVKAFFAGSDEPCVIEFGITLKEVEAATRETYDGNTAPGGTGTTTPGTGGAGTDNTGTA